MSFIAEFYTKTAISESSFIKLCLHVPSIIIIFRGTVCEGRTVGQTPRIVYVAVIRHNEIGNKPTLSLSE